MKTTAVLLENILKLTAATDCPPSDKVAVLSLASRFIALGEKIEARRLPVERLRQTLAESGFAENDEIEFPGETVCLTPCPMFDTRARRGKIHLHAAEGCYKLQIGAEAWQTERVLPGELKRAVRVS